MGRAQSGLSNHGALISVKGTFISVRGDYNSSENGLIHSNDSVFVTGDWINNAGNSGFLNDTGGHVILYNNDQYIQGTDVTRFSHLHLRGGGVKYGSLNVEVDSTLYLNDREMSMDTNTVTVLNKDTAAVQANGGFVSALGSGGLERHTGSIGTYWFPVGSTVGTIRYRPIDITPTASHSKIYKVRLANVDATTEGFDRSVRQPTICVVNEDYYHRIYAQSVSPNLPTANIKFYFDPVLDGDYADILHWQNQPQWEVTDPNLTIGSAAGFNTLELNGWDDFSYPVFALGNESEPFYVEGTDELCLGDTINLTAEDRFITYEFYVNGELVQDSVTNIYTTDGLVDADSLFVIGVDSTCIAYSYPIEFTVFPLPSPDAGEDTTVYFGADVLLEGSGAIDYVWTPDSVLVCPTCPSTIANVFEDTKFNLFGYNEYGCYAIDTVWIYTSEEIDPREVLFIPTAITPNGDAVNEFWNIRNLELYPDNEAIILNRWGDEIYRSNGPYDNEFDGTYNGKPVPAATYYYLLKLNNIGQVLSGPLTVIR